MIIDIPIWMAASISIVAFLGYMAIGLIVTLETDRLKMGSLDEKFIIPILVTWPVTIPVLLMLETWAKRRREKNELNGL